METDDWRGKYRRCPGLVRKKFRQHVGRTIYESPVIEESPLIERIEDDLLIKAGVRDFRAHLRYVLARQPFTYFFRWLTDSDLLDAWLSKNETTDDGRGGTKQGYFSLRDAVDGPDLLIINVGEQASKNRALPSVLLQSLRKRRFADKPTWVRISGNATIRGELIRHVGEEGSAHTECERYISAHFDEVRLDHRFGDEVATSNEVDDEFSGLI